MWKRKGLLSKSQRWFFCHMAIPVGFCQPTLIFFLKSYRNRKYNLGLTFAKLAIQAALQATGMQRQNDTWKFYQVSSLDYFCNQGCIFINIKKSCSCQHDVAVYRISQLKHKHFLSSNFSVRLCDTCLWSHLLGSTGSRGHKFKVSIGPKWEILSQKTSKGGSVAHWKKAWLAYDDKL